ncbi:helix-turn-helix domain-containing protein [Streptomyces sp. NPDC051018]|uniref:helix-turn-helix domain-containing protein n=1 Tax=Streptomyces sp. NPDC051018 TaxID=3365639 RepID=UPI0037B747AA
MTRPDDTPPSVTEHPLTHAVKPLVDAMGGEIVGLAQADTDDVVLAWEGEDVLAVRLPLLSESLDRILAALERTHGKPLPELDRRTKQRVVRNLEARGAFSVRHGVETVAGALGVSRFTVYNYINYASERRARARGGEERTRRDD